MMKYGLSVRLARRVLAAALLILWLEAWIGGQAASADGAASPRDSIEPFRLAAESLYRSVGEGDPLVVLRKVREAEEALMAVPAQALPAAESASALAGGMERMRRAVSALSPDEHEVYDASASLRLAADAVSPRGQGLWLEYRRLMREDAASLGAAIKTADSRTSREAQEKLASLKGHYELIRTAAVAAGKKEEVDRADAVFRYAGRVLAAASPDPALAARLTPQLAETVEALFPPAAEAPTSGPLAAAPPTGFLSVIGAFILTVLTYSGWRKYRDESRTK
ncbi:sporulation protein YpjB [Cohnella sp. JJ-181]|uniref:sporulation protein YpjB n=1 Tax=Cohnella rhizoplanae TaxID=2974897 RepID=UPI0022FF8F2F|nr:sporulation protein YpjB [Cohnella sp. JJ-181]CAI6080990.1 hypothetical protein COHCIP112018_03162 [Cohnella sp. JJ-181]